MSKVFVIDIGGTELKYCTMDDSLVVENEGYVPTPRDTMDHFLDVVKELYDAHPECEGIAMSLPGFIDTKKGFHNGGGALTYAYGLPVGQMLAEKCGCKVHLENDGKAAAIAELKGGSLQDVTNGAVFIIGTGVGGGLIINKELLRGPHFTAGEFSYLLGESSGWDNVYNYVTMTCSTPGLLKMYADESGNTEKIDGRQFFALLPNDEAAQKALHQFCTNIAIQCFNLAVLLDLEKVAIGGGISRQPILVETINKCADELRETYPLRRAWEANFPEIVNCKFLSGANLIGAYLSYRHDL